MNVTTNPAFAPITFTIQINSLAELHELYCRLVSPTDKALAKKLRRKAAALAKQNGKSGVCEIVNAIDDLFDSAHVPSPFTSNAEDSTQELIEAQELMEALHGINDPGQHSGKIN